MTTGPRVAAPGPGLPATLYFDENGSHAGVLETLAMDPFIRGEQPFANSARLDAVRDEATLLPPGVQPTMSVVSNAGEAQLATGEGWTAHAERWRSGGGCVTVTATSAELARSVLALATDGARPAPEPEDERVEIGFWHLTGNGPRRRERPIAAATWAEIRRNYAAAVASAVDRLVGLDARADQRPDRCWSTVRPAPARPRCCARSRASGATWCQVDFVLDPERLFREPGYLIEVTMGVRRGRPAVAAAADRGLRRADPRRAPRRPRARPCPGCSTSPTGCSARAAMC